MPSLKVYRNVMAAALALCAIAGGKTASPQAADGEIPTLKVVTRLVPISAVVKNKKGDPREDLAKEDFVLKQDGKDVAIHYFTRGDAVPLSLALMVDTSASQQTFVGDETIASDVFFETMLKGQGDRATLVEFGTTVRQLKSMTSVPNELHLALSHLDTRAPATGGTLLYDAVYAVARNILATEHGRKAMVILSDGGDRGSRKTLSEAAEEAQRADVQVYSVLYSMWDPLNSNNSAQAGKDPGLEALQKLSEDTGGRVFPVSRHKSLREVYAEIEQDLRTQYELGYVPPPDTRPNTYHKLELKTKEKNMVVQARKGFFETP